MNAKVIIAKATKETVETLYNIVSKVMKSTSIKAYQSVDFEAVFFPADCNDQDFILSILANNGFATKIEKAG